MAEIVELKATARPRVGKGAARAVRREGKLPGVIYGDGKPAEPIALDAGAVWLQFRKGHFLSTVMDIEIDGQKRRVIPRDMQLDPVRDTPVHVDFQRIGADGRVRVGISVKFVNDLLSPGLKRGGVLNIVRHEVECWCPSDNIPAYLEVDLTGLEIGRSIHISHINLPDGVKPTISDRDFTVATIAGTGGKGEDTEAAPAGAAAAAPAAGGDGKAAPAAGGAKPAPAKK